MKISKNCPNCNIEFESEKRDRRKFCSSSCSASFNNQNRNRNRTETTVKECLRCKNEFAPHRSKQVYCSLKCSSEHKSELQYEKIKAGFVFSEGYSPKSAKKFILKEQDCKCNICNNPDEWQGKPIVFVLDHIDGDSSNNLRNNLRLICPNCDSQLDTFKSKNKGKGRHFRRERYKEGKSF